MTRRKLCCYHSALLFIWVTTASTASTSAQANIILDPVPTPAPQQRLSNSPSSTPLFLTLLPTWIPSLHVSITPTTASNFPTYFPTASHVPSSSAAPSESSIPSVMPTKSETPTLFSTILLVPSVLPTISTIPSVSVAPSVVPSSYSSSYAPSSPFPTVIIIPPGVGSKQPALSLPMPTDDENVNIILPPSYQTYAPSLATILVPLLPTEPLPSESPTTTTTTPAKKISTILAYLVWVVNGIVLSYYLYQKRQRRRRRRRRQNNNPHAAARFQQEDGDTWRLEDCSSCASLVSFVDDHDDDYLFGSIAA